jgi:hypothetical protein
MFLWTILPALVTFLIGIGAMFYGIMAFSSADGRGAALGMLGGLIVMLSGILALSGIVVFGVLQLGRLFS